MIAIELPNTSEPQHSTAFVEDLLAAVSSSLYAAPLFRLAHRHTGCDLLTVFSKTGTSSPICLLNSGRGEDAVLSSAARAYCGRHFQVDPILQKVLPSAAADTSVQVQYRASDASDAVYRRDCYEEPNLSERVGFYTRTPDGWIWLNVYRRADTGAFGAQQVDAVAAFAKVFLAAVLSKQPPQPDSTLSLQEREVVRLSLEGATAKMIARQLQLSPSTVTTYRQRAYRKLNVRNQRELVAGRLSPPVRTDVKGSST
ncbi:MAG: hypothetical protein JWQ07_4238 [Ramlibacter sp.]|nr:hypothetical protein [Ramlibacter sp.]